MCKGLKWVWEQSPSLCLLEVVEVGGERDHSGREELEMGMHGGGRPRVSGGIRDWSDRLSRFRLGIGIAVDRCCQ